MRSDITNAILAIAARSHGVCTRRALLESGIGDNAIDRRLADGTLHVVRRGVYTAPAIADDLTPLFRAVLSVPNSVLSRQTAASRRGFPVAMPTIVHVTAPIGASRSVPGVIVHETRRLDSVDVEQGTDGLPITAPARTIFDLVPDLSQKRLHHVVTTQAAIGSPSVEELQACFLRLARRGRPGVARLRELLDELCADAQPVGESELEGRVWQGLHRHHVLGLSPQYKPPWFDGSRGVVDFAHPKAAVIVEADGRRWHARHEAMAEDRRRDRRAAVNGWVVVRVMWEDVVHKSAETFGELAEIIDTRLTERAA
jgi:very-short-patch-repair endonuclease